MSVCGGWCRATIPIWLPVATLGEPSPLPWHKRGGRARVAFATQNPQDASMSVSTILLILAFIAFVLAAIGWGYRKTNLLGIGLALWVLSILITQVHFG